LLMERAAAQRVRLLLEREPRGGPSALEPGARAPHRRAVPPQDTDVQRLRRAGRVALRGDGLEEELLRSQVTCTATAVSRPDFASPPRPSGRPRCLATVEGGSGRSRL